MAKHLSRLNKDKFFNNWAKTKSNVRHYATDEIVNSSSKNKNFNMKKKSSFSF